MSIHIRRIFRLIIVLTITAISGFLLASEAPAELSLGLYHSEDTILGKTASTFMRSLNGRSSVRLRIYFKFGHPRELFEKVQVGEIDITLVPVSYLRSISPKMDILQLPFLFENHDAVDRVLDSENNIGRELLSELESGNMKGLAFWEVGFRHITTTYQPISTPWDLKGLKIRTGANDILDNAFKLLGATPVRLSQGEVYEALNKGVLNAQEGTIDTIYQSRMYETQKFLSLTRHAYTTWVLVMNNRKFNQLSKAEQNDVRSAAREATKIGRELARKMERENINNLSRRGMRVSTPEWLSFHKKVFYEIKERFVREDGRRLLEAIERSTY